jgi:pimeloyl-ACP methyl ester carboxylesterase
MSRSSRFPHALLLLLAFGLACAAPVGVKRVDPRVVQRELAQSILTSKAMSSETQNVVRLSDLERDLRKRPEETLAFVHGLLLENARNGEPVSQRALISLAEIAFDIANRTGERRYYFASALYAWLFLFPLDPALTPDPFDPRLRLAADLYNRSVTLAFTDPKADVMEVSGEAAKIREGVVELPVGQMVIEIDESTFRWGDRRLVAFEPVSEFEVRGLRNRYRYRGLGAPLAAILDPKESDGSWDDFLPKNVRLPVSAILRIMPDEETAETGVFRARLELHAAADGETIEIAGETVPLELEPTSSIASMMKGENPLWRDLKRFFAGDVAFARQGLISLEPYRPGRIPVILVHGTFSSSSTWAEVVNDLSADPEIRRRFQFWLFDYSTGNPIGYSAWLLRTAMQDLVASVDPEGKDPALQRAIVVGHSQGGLLTKLTAVDSGLDLWHLMSDKAPDEVELSPKSREILEGALLVEPVPMVERVVFVATPHGGSYLANYDIAKWASRFVRSPITVADAAFDLVTNNEEDNTRRDLARVSGSLDNMSPGNKFLAALRGLPVADGITSHSIIALDGDIDDPEEREDGSDGVVKFHSAEIPGVESELVVPSPHTCLAHPWTIAELRRILLEHVGLVRRGPKELDLP